MELNPTLFLKLSGYFQLALCIGSLFIPGLLNWKSELSKVSTIVSQIFWTYAGYILVINLSFGLISIFGADELLNKSFLAKSISGFIFVYWLSRILVQIFYFDTKSTPKGAIYLFGEVGLMALFTFLTIIYALIFYLNFQQ